MVMFMKYAFVYEISGLKTENRVEFYCERRDDIFVLLSSQYCKPNE